ncbi:MAG: glycosyltransferase family 4 protein [Chloroflexi bacterium]|nr:glycosyltransferase family 4 protein [Chloroflexota bacterium]
MRILAIAPTGFFTDYGCHIRIRGHLQALQGRGHEVHLVTYPAGRTLPSLPTTRPPLPWARTMPVGSSRRKIFLDALLLPTLSLAAFRFRPDALYAFLHEGALLAWLLSRWQRIPVLFDYQGSLTAEMLDHHFISARSPFLSWLEKLERWIERQPQALFPSSQTTYNLLLQRGLPQERLHLLPDSVDPDLFHPQAPDLTLYRRLGLDEQKAVVAYLGLLAPYQGVDLLLQAMAHPLLRNAPIQLLMMGFPRVEHYQNMAKHLGVADKVRFTGAIPYTEAPRYLALADLALAPKLSTTEGSGKLLPYMSMALPIVATDTPVHRQYLGSHAIYAKTATAEGLAQAIRSALDSLDALRAEAKQLRAIVEQRYTWDQAGVLLENTLLTLSRA